MLRFDSLLRFVAISAVLGCLPSQAFAFAPQNKEKGPAFTEAPSDDLSYALMGEFVGLIKTDGNEMQVLGLQLRSIGSDQLDAIAYRGGLPGQEKHQPEPIPLIGKRSGDFVVLSGGPWAIIVEKNSCRLIDRKGRKIGNLKRIRRTSPTLYAQPPEGATILFDGSGTDQFVNAEMTADGLLAEGADLKPMFQDFDLHIEFRLPYMPQADGQNRANSGLYLQSRYECQVLDSFAQTIKIDGCGALYRFKKPDLNMCFPPLVWQTYDVHFTAPRWAADGSKIRNAQITSWLNGVKVQDNVSLPNKTGAGKPEAPLLLPSKFQDHGDPVRFRNAWIVDRGLTTAEFPVFPTEEQVAAAIKAEQQKKKDRVKAARIKAAAEKKAAQQQQAAELNKQAAENKAAENKAAEKKAAAEQPEAAGNPPAKPGKDEASAEPAAAPPAKEPAKRGDKDKAATDIQTADDGKGDSD